MQSSGLTRKFLSGHALPRPPRGGSIPAATATVAALLAVVAAHRLLAAAMPRLVRTTAVTATVTTTAIVILAVTAVTGLAARSNGMAHMLAPTLFLVLWRLLLTRTAATATVM